MQIHVYNQSGSTVTIQAIEISPSNTYAIPSENLKAWCGDLSLRMAMLCNLVQFQDSMSNAIAIEDAQELMRAILTDQVGVS